MSEGDIVDMETLENDESMYIAVEGVSSIKIKLKSGKEYSVTKDIDSKYTITNGVETKLLSVGESMELRDGNEVRRIMVGSLVVSGILASPGCTDSAANNYNEYATVDDGSCEYDVSDICFYAGSMVLTDKGEKAIEEIDVEKDKINGREIEVWTKIKSIEKEIVVMNEGCLGDGIPNRETRITKQHKVYYEGVMEDAGELEKRIDGISLERYDGSYVYNIGTREYGVMIVNGMKAETLNPSSKISRSLGLRLKENKMRRILK